MPAGTDSLILTSSQQYSDNKQTRIQFAEIMRAREQSTVVPKLCDSATVQPGHYTIRYPLIGRLSAGPVEEGREIDTPVAMPTWSREVETVEWGVLSFRSDRVQRQTATHNITTEINTRQGEAMARQEEEEVLDLFDDISTKIDNSGNTYLTADGSVALTTAGSSSVRPKGVNPNTFAMAKQEIMRERDTNLGPPPAGANPFAVLAPSAVFQLTQNVLSSAAAASGIGGPAQGGGGVLWSPGDVAVPSGLSEEIIRTYTVGRVGGVDVYQTPNIKVLDNSDGTAVKTYNPRTGEEITTAASNQTGSVSNGNSTSHGAVLINKSILLVREKEFNVDSEYMPRMRGEWYVATQEFKPYLMYDAWSIFINAQAPVLKYSMPTNPLGFE